MDKVWLFGYKIGPYRLIFYQHIEKTPTLPVCFLEEKKFDQEKVKKINILNFEQNCFCQNFKYQFSQHFLDQIFFQKTNVLSLFFSICGLNMSSYESILEPKTHTCQFGGMWTRITRYSHWLNCFMSSIEWFYKIKIFLKGCVDTINTFFTGTQIVKSAFQVKFCPKMQFLVKIINNYENLAVM